MSPTIAELAIGLVAAVLAFMLAMRVIPLIIDSLADSFNRSLDNYVERKNEHSDRWKRSFTPGPGGYFVVERRTCRGARRLDAALHGLANH